MVGNLLLRGMLVGAFAAVLAFGFARTFGEPQVDRAIAFEEQMSKAKGEAAEPELVSRDVQSSIGLFTGLTVYGAAMGGLLSLVFAFVYGRFGRIGPRALAALLALGAFVAISLVPAIKYPPNPPAIGSAETIGPRTTLFFLMLLLSVAALVGAVALARQLSARYGNWNAATIAGIAFILGIALIEYGMPTINEVPDQFSAVVLWQFRVAALGIHAVLWATIGLGFGYAAERCFAHYDGQRYGARSLAR
jgi:predicted cobalt transporter CbtA